VLKVNRGEVPHYSLLLLSPTNYLPAAPSPPRGLPPHPHPGGYTPRRCTVAIGALVIVCTIVLGVMTRPRVQPKRRRTQVLRGWSGMIGRKGYWG